MLNIFMYNISSKLTLGYIITCFIPVVSMYFQSGLNEIYVWFLLHTNKIWGRSVGKLLYFVITFYKENSDKI